MNRAWRKIDTLVGLNAKHKRKHFKLGEVSPSFILKQAVDELEELIASPIDPYEMADLLAILFHYCIMRGWSMASVENKIIAKLKVRFETVENREV